MSQKGSMRSLHVTCMLFDGPRMTSSCDKLSMSAAEGFFAETKSIIDVFCIRREFRPTTYYWGE